MATAYQYRALIRILATDQAAVNQAAKDNLDSVGGELTFTVGLSPLGLAPATHYVASAVMTVGGLTTTQALCAVFPKAEMHVWVAKEPGTVAFLDSLYDDPKYQDDNELTRTHARVHVRATPLDFQSQLTSWGLQTIGE